MLYINECLRIVLPCVQLIYDKNSRTVNKLQNNSKVVFQQLYCIPFNRKKSPQIYRRLSIFDRVHNQLGFFFCFLKGDNFSSYVVQIGIFQSYIQSTHPDGCQQFSRSNHNFFVIKFIQFSLLFIWRLLIFLST